jgi:TonB family protein
MRVSVLLLVLAAIFFASTGAQRHKTARRPLPNPVQLTEEVLLASATRKVEPSYPRVARAARVSGSVQVEVTVDENGNVIKALPLSGHPLLKDCATQAARGWKYKPVIFHGRPVKATGIISFNFDWRCEYLSFGPSKSSLQIPCEYPSDVIIPADRAYVAPTVSVPPEFLPPHPGGSVPPLPRQYWLTGRVVDDRTGIPVQGAMVEIGQDHKVWGRATTSERGEFSFYDVPATRIDLKGSRARHIEVLLFMWPGTDFQASRYTSQSKTITVADMNGIGIPGASTITLRIMPETSISKARHP